MFYLILAPKSLVSDKLPFINICVMKQKKTPEDQLLKHKDKAYRYNQEHCVQA